MNGFPAYTTIHLAAGTFNTLGKAGFYLKAGYKVYGAGRGQTIVRLVGFSTAIRKHEIFCCSGDCDSIEVHDLTLDGNYAGLKGLPGWEAGDAVCGINLCGNNTLIENVETIHLYGDGTKNLEEFSILIGGGGPNDMKSNCTIENCITHEYAISPADGGYTFGPAIAYCNGGQILNSLDDGALHGFGGGIGDNTLIQGNTTTANTYVGWYSDTATLKNVTINHNWFTAALIPLQWNNSSPGTNIQITDNTFTTDNNSEPGNTAAIYLNQGGLSNVLISGNHVEYTGTGDYQFIANGGHNTGLTIEDNSGTAIAGGRVYLCITMSVINMTGNTVGTNYFGN